MVASFYEISVLRFLCCNVLDRNCDSCNLCLYFIDFDYTFFSIVTGSY